MFFRTNINVMPRMRDHIPAKLATPPSAFLLQGETVQEVGQTLCTVSLKERAGLCWENLSAPAPLLCEGSHNACLSLLDCLSLKRARVLPWQGCQGSTLKPVRALAGTKFLNQVSLLCKFYY
jgi:hypothetical protein